MEKCRKFIQINPENYFPNFIHSLTVIIGTDDFNQYRGIFCGWETTR